MSIPSPRCIPSPRRGTNITAQGNALGSKGALLTKALKGRNTAWVVSLFRPFRAYATCAGSIPGRCPGLICYGPFGAKFVPDRFPGSICDGPVGARVTALSLVECVISIVLVSGVLIAALNTVGGAALARTQAADRSIGYMLGAALMTEILQTNYKEPDTAVLFGLETGDVDAIGGTRTNWDDVDDYHNLSETPIERKGGRDYTDRTGWRRTVRIDFVRRANVAQTTVSDEGLKRITVTVTYLDVVAAQLTAILSDTEQSIKKTKKPLIVLNGDLELLD